MAREKKIIDDSDFVNNVARTQRVTEGLINPHANFIIPDEGAFHHFIPSLTNVNQKIYLPPPVLMPLGGVYTYPYMSPLIVPNPSITQVDNNPATIFTQSLPFQSLEELKE